MQKKTQKNLKIGRLIAIFVCLTKIQKRVNKNEKQMRLSAIFELKQKNVICISKPGQNIISLLKQNIQIPSSLSSDRHH